MKITMAAALLFAALCPAGSLQQTLERLVAPDAWAISGLNVERFTNSPLAKIRLADNSFVPVGFDTVATGQVTDVAVIARNALREDGDLEIYAGRFTAKPIPLSTSEYETAARQGLTVVTYKEGPSVAMLSSNTIISGSQRSVDAAIDRWTQGGAQGAIHEKLRDMTERFDAWALIVHPLKNLGGMDTGQSAQLERLVQMVEEIRAGARFGGSAQVIVEADFASGLDAMAAATAARWLPDWLAWQRHGGVEAELIAAIEGFTTHADGHTASLSFDIPNFKVLEIAERFRRARVHW